MNGFYKIMTGLFWWALLAGCQKDDSLPQGKNIFLYAEIEPLGQLDKEDYDGEKICFAKGTFPSCYTEVWKATLSDSMAILDEKLIYPADNSPVYLRGFYPVAKLDIGEVRYELDGRQDVMKTVGMAGSLLEPFDCNQKRFRFSHLLTQISFIPVSDSLRPVSGRRLLRLEVTGTHSHVRLNVNDGISIFGGDKRPVLVYAADSIPARSSRVATVADTLLGPVMVEPDVPLWVDVRFVESGDTVTCRDIPLYLSGGGYAEAGTAYRIEFDMEKITSGLWLNAEVSDWIWKDDGFTIETTY